MTLVTAYQPSIVITSTNDTATATGKINGSKNGISKNNGSYKLAYFKLIDTNNNFGLSDSSDNDGDDVSYDYVTTKRLEESTINLLLPVDYNTTRAIIKGSVVIIAALQGCFGSNNTSNEDVETIIQSRYHDPYSTSLINLYGGSVLFRNSNKKLHPSNS